MILYLKEEDTYTTDELNEKLESILIKDKEAFYAQTLTSRILLPTFEKSKELDQEAKFEIQKYKINYVGIIKFESSFIIVYPKYIQSVNADVENSNYKFKEILNVIDKYNITNIFDYNKSFNEEKSFFNLQLKMWKDYVLNGLYSNEIETLELNGEGEIFWEETISNILPYLSHGIPVYLDTYTKKRENELDNLARQVHLAILSEIQDNFSLISDLLGFETHFFETNGFENLGDVDYLIRSLEDELRKQNVTTKQNILKDMISYLELQKKKSSDSTLYLYGTTSFNLVWEDICKKVYKDHLEEKLSNLPALKLQGRIFDDNNNSVELDYTNRVKLKDIVDKPLWIKNDGAIQVYASKGSLLDVLHVNFDNKAFEIYDGKYYDIEFTDTSIKGQPGTEDVIKQYFYQLAFNKLAQLNQFSFRNYFVVPKDDFYEDQGNGVELYRAKISYLSELLLEDIVVIGRDCSTFFKQYLN